jgi:light-regulated signal transduction histidine kinase (bacteriophytochrome)
MEAFSYSLTHDLRKPLTVINGYAQAIEEMCGSHLGEECQGFLSEIYEATVRMNALIDAVLRFSRVTSGALHPEPIDLSAMADKVAAELRLAEVERNIVFHISRGVTAKADPDLLLVVMENLLGNAWKYTGRQEEALVEFGMQEDASGAPTYFVRDNGIGFDMALAGDLFVPFRRLKGAEEFKGEGIGLATVDRIIRRHGGRIWAESEPGKGATFFFQLGQQEDEASA